MWLTIAYIKFAIMTPLERRKYICATVPEMTHANATAVFCFILLRLPAEISFSVHSNGSSINLDKLSDELIAQLYIFVLTKAEAESDDDGESQSTSMQSARDDGEA
jgi:hypothetical protein